MYKGSWLLLKIDFKYVASILKSLNGLELKKVRSIFPFHRELAFNWGMFDTKTICSYFNEAYETY